MTCATSERPRGATYLQLNNIDGDKVRIIFLRDKDFLKFRRKCLHGRKQVRLAANGSAWTLTNAGALP